MKKNTSGTSREGGQNPVVTPTKPPDREHELSRDCWCQPIVDGTAPDEVPLEELIEHQRSIYDGDVSTFGTESHWTVLSGSILASLLELQDRRAALQSAPDQGCAEAVAAQSKLAKVMEGLRETYEIYAGMEGIPLPKFASEAYLLRIIDQMQKSVTAILRAIEGAKK